MTLSEAVARLRTRCEVDLANNVVATDEIVRAAKQVSRDTFFLFSHNAALSLSANDQQFDLLSSSKCVPQIFRVDGLYINGSWLTRVSPRYFLDNFTDYLTASATATPAFFMVKDQYRVVLPAPITSAGANATNYARGWQLHTTYTWDVHQETELLGPDEYHELIVDRAALNVTKSYVAGQEALQRRAVIEGDYLEKSKAYRAGNLADFKPAVRNAGAGNVRRYFGPGYGD